MRIKLDGMGGGVDSCWPRIGAVTGFCEHRNEP
jgi:hypothetical protein